MKPYFFTLFLFSFLFWASPARQDAHRYLSSPATTLPTTAPSSGRAISGDKKADLLLQALHRQLHLTPSDSLRVLARSIDKKGHLHLLVQQTHQGVAVVGAWYNLHEKDGALAFSNGTVFKAITINTTPVVTHADALNLALHALPAARYAWQDEQFEKVLRRQQHDNNATFYPQGELVIVPRRLFPSSEQDSTANAFHLAWRFDVFALEPELRRERIFIDATDGRLLHRLPLMAHCHAPARGKAAYRSGLVDIDTDSCNGSATPLYRLHDPIRNIEIFDSRNTQGTPSFGFFSNSTLWLPPQADTVAVAAMYGLRIWYDHLLDHFGWRGFDNRPDQPTQAWVHFGYNLENALYAGFLLFGDGNPHGKYKTPLVSRDIVAHEATHGLIEHTGRLLYVYESGILNEAIADIFACLVELEQGDGNWILGEDLLPGGVRRLDAPGLLGLPDTYKGQFWVEQAAPDQALHHNASVFGHWFYLLAEGGVGVNDVGTTYSVHPMGRRRAADLLFHAMRYHFLNPNDGFYAARRGIIQAAGDLNWNQEDLDNLAMAWCAIGVGGCDVRPSESVTLLAPDGGETYQAGDTILLEWENTAGIDRLKILFSANDGASWQDLGVFQITGVAGRKALPAPQVNSRLCRLRLVALSDPLAFDDTDSTFTILGCNLLAGFTISPAGGCAGANFTIDNTSFATDAHVSWAVDGLLYPAPAGGFSLQSPDPGMHTIQLIARQGTCVDTFHQTFHVTPMPSADFQPAVSNLVVTAAAGYADGERYRWSVDGQALPDFNDARSLVWTAPAAGTYEICLFVEDHCSPRGEQVCRTVTVTEPVSCIGTSDGWKQYNNLSEFIDMAEYGDTLILTTTGGLVFFDKLQQRTVNLLNTTTTPSLPCQGLGSIAVDRERKWVYVALEHGHGFVRVDLTTYAVTHFTTWNVPQLFSNDVTVLRVDPSGKLWIGTRDKGVWVGVPGEAFQGVFRQELPTQAVVDIDFSDGSVAWVALTNALAKVENNAVVQVYTPADAPFSSNSVLGLTSVLADGDIVWVGTKLGLHRLASGVWKTFTSEDYNYLNNHIIDVEKLNDGSIVFGINSQFIKYNGSSFELITCFNEPNRPGDRAIRRLLRSQDKIWVGCGNRLRSWDKTNACRVYSTGGFPIFSNKIADIFNGDDGTTYIVEKSSLVKINGDTVTPFNIEPYLSANTDLVSLSLNNLALDEQGVAWISLRLSGHRLAKINPGGAWKFIDPSKLPFIPQSQYVGLPKLAIHKNYLYHSNPEGLFRLNILTGEWMSMEDMNGPAWGYSEVDMEFDQQGNLWLAKDYYSSGGNTSDRLLKFDGENWDTIFLDSPRAAVDAFAISSDGTIWAAVWYYTPPGFGRRIMKYKNGSGWTVLQPATNIINFSTLNGPSDVTVDQAGNILISTPEAGVYKIDPEGNVLAHYTTCNSGLIHNNVYKTTIDTLTGAVWFATEQGVSVFTPASEVIRPEFRSPQGVCVGVAADFTNTTLGAVGWEWKINGKAVGTDRQLRHTFQAPGEYIVELTAVNAQGCATAVSQAVSVHPVADLSGMELQLVDCDASREICAPPGMAVYEWRKGGQLVGSTACLTVTRSGSGAYELRVTDHCGRVQSATIAVTLSGACVFPGDTDNNGIVDFRDHLWLGYSFGFHGLTRPEQGVNWKPYPAEDWNGNLPNGGANLKYCDCTGDGKIDLSDFRATEVNYLYTHGNPAGLPTSAQSPYIFTPVLVRVDTTLGDNRYRLDVDIVAKNTNGSAIDNFYGVGMRVYFVPSPRLQIDGTPTFSFNGSSLGLEGINALGLVKAYPNLGFMDVAFTRLDHLNQAGSSVIGQASFVVIDDHLPIFDSLQFTLNVVGGTAITNEGNFIPVNGAEKTFAFTSSGEITGSETPLLETAFKVYPNPTTGRCWVELPISSAREVVLQVLNAQSTEVWATVTTGQTSYHELDLSGWPAGLYWLVITSDQERRWRKIVKLNQD